MPVKLRGHDNSNMLLFIANTMENISVRCVMAHILSPDSGSLMLVASMQPLIILMFLFFLFVKAIEKKKTTFFFFLLLAVHAVTTS